MSRHPTERHNEEFRRLYDLGGNMMTIMEISEHMGVSDNTIKQWLKPLTSKNAMACPKYRVDAFKVILRKRLKPLLKALEG